MRRTITPIVTTVLMALASLGFAGGALASPDAEQMPVANHGSVVGIIIDHGKGGDRATRASLTVMGSLALPEGHVVRGGGGAGTSILEFPAPLATVEAEAVAARVESWPGVSAVELDVLLHPLLDRVIPDDPRFDEQWDLWDARGAGSIRAPYMWGVTTGRSDVVVAVVDTGETAHPDLRGQTVPGYDFVSNRLRANDGDGRDPDPSDPGDWITAREASGAYRGCEPGNSSWHGTHVMGTIVARQGNGTGISGVAPGVRVQTVRALGKCGGALSDVVDAIRWAAGGSVRGVPDNPTPASVINLSLGGPGLCTGSIRSAIDFATARGVTVVAAAGNSRMPLADFVPAGCPGVVSVVASDQRGQRSSYSNYGTSAMAATITAPGGGGTSRILSTYNSGRQGPDRPTYVGAQGTSMAAPHVAAAAALAHSMGLRGREVIEALTSSARSLANAGCSRTQCGAGLLDLEGLAGILVDLDPPNPDPDPEPDPPTPDPDPEPDPEPTPATVPDPIEEFSVSYAYARRGASATVTWVRPGDGGSRITGYVARSQRRDGSWARWRTVSSPRLVVRGLPIGRFTEVEIAAVNAIGTGGVIVVTLFPT